jgi:hypothetical protein
MARTFNGTSDGIVMTVGGCAITGALSIAAICQRTTATVYAAIMDAVGTGFWELGVQPSGAVPPNRLNFATQGGNTNATSLTLVTADAWCLIAVTKTSGTTTPRFHKYVYSSNTWTHEAGIGTVPDNTGTNTVADIGISGSDLWKGDIHAVGVWNAALSDAQVENLAFTLPSWFSVSPAALWLLDQSATSQKVLDWSGGGANESSLTGTSVATSSVPVFNYTDGAWMPTIVFTAAQPLARPVQVVNQAVARASVM